MDKETVTAVGSNLYFVVGHAHVRGSSYPEMWHGAASEGSKACHAVCCCLLSNAAGSTQLCVHACASESVLLSSLLVFVACSRCVGSHLVAGRSL